MSNSDSFIDEVTDEVRRDRLYATFRRWAWVAVLAVVLVVAGAAWNEWRKARETARAQALGDAVVAALTLPEGEERAEALMALDAGGPAEAFTNLLAAAETVDEDDRATAIGALEAVASDEEVADRYAHLAALKLILLGAGDPDPAARIAALEPLSASGAPYRLLAQEQIALARVEQGEGEDAIAILRDILADEGASQDLRRRATQLIVALGGEVTPT